MTLADTLTTTAEPSVAEQIVAVVLLALMIYGACVAFAALIGMLEVIRYDVKRSLGRVRLRYRAAVWERHVDAALLLANEWDVHCAEAFLVARAWERPGRPVPRATYVL